MKNLILPATDVTPEVNFNSKTGELLLSGLAMPEDSPKFFIPIINWVSEYKSRPASTTHLEFKMDYFNTSSEIFILKLIKSVVEIHRQGKSVIIKWHYNLKDDDMEYTGRYLEKLSGFTFQIIEINELKVN